MHFPVGAGLRARPCVSLWAGMETCPYVFGMICCLNAQKKRKRFEFLFRSSHFYQYSSLCTLCVWNVVCGCDVP